MTRHHRKIFSDVRCCIDEIEENTTLHKEIGAKQLSMDVDFLLIINKHLEDYARLRGLPGYTNTKKSKLRGVHTDV